MKKIALVTTGSGTQGAYVAGVLDALVSKKIDFTDPSIIVASSGGISLLYYVARQYPAFKNIWINLLPTKKFISFARFWRIMDIDYMVDSVFKKQDILNVDEVLRSQTRLFLNVTNCDTGTSEYLSNDGRSDLFEAMRATTAVPLLYNKKVEINGSYYVDGQISSSLGQNIEKAVAEGAEKVVVIHYDSGSEFSANSKLFWKTCSLFTSRPVRKTINRYLKGEYEVPFPENIPIFHITPSRKLPVEPIDNNRSRLLATFELGRNDVLVNKEALLRFLGK